MLRTKLYVTIQLLQLCLSIVLLISAVQAQIANVDDTTSTPVEGAGHDYIHLLSETVNPGNGSVSLRIALPVAKGRGMTLPFSIDYDSGSVNHLLPKNYPQYGYVSWAPNVGTLIQGGWNYSVPGAGTTLSSPTEGNYPNYYTCNVYSGYVFRDSSGGLHSFGLGDSDGGPTGTTADCVEEPIAAGGDDEFTATFSPVWTPPNPFPVQPPSPGSIVVSSGDGTIYSFSSVGVGNGTSEDLALPTYIEDRNGNKIVSSSSGSGSSFKFNFTDTLGRTSLSSNGFGPSGTTNTVTIAGVAYQITWKNTSANFSVPSTYVGPNGGGPTSSYDSCNPIPAASDTQTVVSKIALPNGQSYTFYYGTDTTPHSALTNSYGLLSEIDYPSGAWATYTWKLSDTLNELADYPGAIIQACQGEPGSYCPGVVRDGCLYQYKSPVVATRQVGFGGNPTAALTQSFTYSTTWASAPSGFVGGISWTQKTTKVNTTDNTTGKSSLTTYTYGPVNLPLPAYDYSIPGQAPVETSVSYFDWGNTTTPLKTINKTWLDLFEMTSEQVNYPTSQSTLTNYTYGPFVQVTEKDEYSLGVNPPSPPTRKTVTTYQSFSGAPGQLADKPCKVVTSDGNGNAVSETDFLYDGGTTVCGAAGSASTSVVSSLVAGTHDETLFSSGSTMPRGNVSKKIQWLNGGASPATTYTYDETGQVLSSTDACGNTTCSDMSGSNHTTNYSYTDSYTVLSGGSNVSYTPSNGNTNALLTKITDPLLHIQTFKYDYNNSQLTSSTDVNGRTTGYTYNDSFSRPTLVTRPDGGQTTVTYNDSAYNPSTNTPSVTSTQTIASGVSETNITATDGVGHVVRTILNSDPQGADTTDTTYDGFGRVLTQSNPHRSSSSSTDGTTSYTYDALGRTTLVTKQDGSAVNTLYDEAGVNTTSICTTAIDEAGNSRKSCSDGLGRLVEVDEPGAGSTNGKPGTGTIGVGGSPESVTINPCSGNQPPAPTSCPQTIYDSGTVYVTVNGFQVSAGYGGSTNMAATIASELTTALNASGSPVSASLNGTTVTITSRTLGADTNFSVSSSTSWYTQYFSSPSYTAGSAGMSGGTDPSLGTSPLVTLYTYDLLNNLTCAVQKGTDTTAFTTCAAASATWRPRSFIYDTLSRLSSATNPESGTISYTYDANGNVATKVAPLPNSTTGSSTETISYFYEPENRLTKKTYSDGTTPTPQYAYDGNSLSGCTYAVPTLSDSNPIHRRTAMCDGSGATHWALDITANVGWKSTEARNVAGITNTIVSQNNFGGMLYQLTYPSGRIITYTPSAAARYLSGVDSGNSINYAQNATYAPPGELISMTNGAAPITVTNAYNERLQPVTLSAGTTASTIMSLSYNFHRANGDNGNVYQIVNNRDNNRNQTFTYDSLNRISTALTQSTNGPTCWGESFTIDNWGNLTNKTVSQCTAESLNAPAANSNQISGYCYDKAGNLLGPSACPNSTYAYDGENRLLSTAGVTYTYDGDGNRVKKSNGTLYWGSGPLAESDLSGNMQREYIFFNGKRIARRDVSGNTVHYYFSDHLGTTSITTDANGDMSDCPSQYSPLGYTTVATGEDESDYFPYGGERQLCNRVPQNYKFTGKERDSESGLDNFDFRYYGSSLGRFLKPDDDSGQRWGDPQTLNLYAYVSNIPLSNIDPGGHDCVYLNNAGNGVESVDQQSSEGECGSHGGYWVNGGVTDVQVNPYMDTVELTGTTNGQETKAYYVGSGTPDDQEIMADMIPNGRARLGLNNWAGRAIPIAQAYTFVFLMKAGGPEEGGAEEAGAEAGTAEALMAARPPWAWNPGGYVNWLKNLQKAGVKLSDDQADAVIAAAKTMGVDVRLDPPHPGTNWNVPHLNIGNEGQVHLEVPAGYANPTVPQGH